MYLIKNKIFSYTLIIHEKLYTRHWSFPLLNQILNIFQFKTFRIKHTHIKDKSKRNTNMTKSRLQMWM